MRKNFLNLCLFGGASFVAAVLAELLFRLCIYGHFVKYPDGGGNKYIHAYSANKDLIYELKPNFASFDGKYKTNRYGMRDYEYSMAKASNTIRVCLLGDSISFGLGLESLDQTFENLLEKRLNRYGPTNKFEVLNFSVAGYNSYQEEIVLKEKVLKFSPDMILVGFCLNDDSYTDGIGELAKEMSPNALGAKLHSKLVSYILHQYGRRTYKSRSDMGKVKFFLRRLAIIKKQQGIDVLVLIFPRSVETYEYRQKRREVASLAKQNDLSAIDLMDSWKDVCYKDRKTWYLSQKKDTSHFSVVGMRKVADVLFAYFAKKYNLG